MLKVTFASFIIHLSQGPTLRLSVLIMATFPIPLARGTAHHFQHQIPHFQGWPDSFPCCCLSSEQTCPMSYSAVLCGSQWPVLHLPTVPCWFFTFRLIINTSTVSNSLPHFERTAFLRTLSPTENGQKLEKYQPCLAAVRKTTKKLEFRSHELLHLWMNEWTAVCSSCLLKSRNINHYSRKQ